MEYGSFQAEEFGDLQRLVDGLFYDRHTIDRLDLIVQAEALFAQADIAIKWARRFLYINIGACGQKIANMSTVTFLVTAILN